MARPEGHKDPGYLRETIEEQGISTIHFVPSMLQAFVDEGDWRDCPSLVRMRATKPERVLTVQWTTTNGRTPSVELSVSAYDRRGLVRDITDVLAFERLSIEAMTTTTDRGAGTAHVLVTVGVDDLDQLVRVLKRLAAVPNVIHARRLR